MATPTRSPKPTNPGFDIVISDGVLRTEYDRGYGDGYSAALRVCPTQSNVEVIPMPSCSDAERPFLKLLIGFFLGFSLGILLGLFIGLFVCTHLAGK